MCSQICHRDVGLNQKLNVKDWVWLKRCKSSKNIFSLLCWNHSMVYYKENQTENQQVLYSHWMLRKVTTLNFNSLIYKVARITFLCPYSSMILLYLCLLILCLYEYIDINFKMLFTFNISSKSSIYSSWICSYDWFIFTTQVRIFSPKRYTYLFWLPWCLVELALKITWKINIFNETRRDELSLETFNLGDIQLN